MDKVWWNNITRARRFLEDVAETILKGESILLSIPQNTPWYPAMIELIQERLKLENSKNAFEYIRCPEEEAGLYLLNKYCKREKRSAYRYGMTYAAFLGKSEDIVLNDRYIWITDIPNDKCKEWVEFILDYQKNVTSKSPAVFILEVHEDNLLYKAKKGIKKILFDQQIGAYDKFAFCTLAAAENNCKDYLRPYLAELISDICKDDIELCAECVREGKRFLDNPQKVLKNITEVRYRSNGERYDFWVSEEEIKQCIWETQLKYIFPMIEKYRNYFITQYLKVIESSLPIHNSNGEVVENPYDIEIGTLLYMVSSGIVSVNTKEQNELQMYRTARNKLAHLDILDLETVETILKRRIKQ